MKEYLNEKKFKTQNSTIMDEIQTSYNNLINMPTDKIKFGAEKESIYKTKKGSYWQDIGNYTKSYSL